MVFSSREDPLHFPSYIVVPKSRTFEILRFLDFTGSYLFEHKKKTLYLKILLPQGISKQVELFNILSQIKTLYPEYLHLKREYFSL